MILLIGMGIIYLQTTGHCTTAWYDSFIVILWSVHDGGQQTALGYAVEILNDPYTCFDASKFAVLLIVDPEEGFFREEIAHVGGSSAS